jgi:hypothetical protein
MRSRGKKVDWPEGMSLEDARRKEDYPPRVWGIAQRRWSRLTPEEQENRRRALEAIGTMLSHAAEEPDFSEFFSLWDILWFALATITAYKIGVGTYWADE